MNAWLQLNFHDRSVHYFTATGGLVKAKCGLYFNTNHTHEPRVNHSCPGCLEKGAPKR